MLSYNLTLDANRKKLLIGGGQDASSALYLFNQNHLALKSGVESEKRIITTNSGDNGQLYSEQNCFPSSYVPYSPTCTISAPLPTSSTVQDHNEGVPFWKHVDLGAKLRLQRKNSDLFPHVHVISKIQGPEKTIMQPNSQGHARAAPVPPVISSLAPPGSAPKSSFISSV